MVRPPLKSIEEYNQAGGWAYHKFLDHVEAILNDPLLLRVAKFEVTDNILYMRSGGALLSFMVQQDGRAKEYLTIVNGINRQELVEFHFSSGSDEIIKSIYHILDIKEGTNDELD